MIDDIYTITLDRFRQVSRAYRQAAENLRTEGAVAPFMAAKHWLEVAQTETDKAEAIAYPLGS